MKYIINKLLSLLSQERNYIKDIFIVIVITRLMFLEDNSLALLAEIVSGLVVIFTSSAEKSIEE